MAVERSAWRGSDAVAYDEMRTTADALVATLLSATEPALSEARAVVQEALSIDGFARPDVDDARVRFTKRIKELQGAHFG